MTTHTVISEDYLWLASSGVCLPPLSAVEKSQSSGQHILTPGDFTLKAPIYDPQKLICIGMNYVDHCTEQNIPVPKEPVIFSKFASAITEPNGAVVLTDETQVRTACLTIIGCEGGAINSSVSTRIIQQYCIDFYTPCRLYNKVLQSTCTYM